MHNITINALDGMDSLLWAGTQDTAQSFTYGPYGSTSARDANHSLLPGYNGERLDPVSQTYHLGNGYRTYNPTLMRFNAPDSWSPFGAGGLNMYAYCEGDPINRSDPSGHMSWQAGVGIGLGILGLLGAVFSFGSSLVAAAAAEAALTASMALDLAAGAAGVAAGATGIASIATRQSDPEASKILGWVSFGLGLAAFGTETGGRISKKMGESTSLLTDANGPMMAGDQPGPSGHRPEAAAAEPPGSPRAARSSHQLDGTPLPSTFQAYESNRLTRNSFKYPLQSMTDFPVPDVPHPFQVKDHDFVISDNDIVFMVKRDNTIPSALTQGRPRGRMTVHYDPSVSAAYIDSIVHTRGEAAGFELGMRAAYQAGLISNDALIEFPRGTPPRRAQELYDIPTSLGMRLL